MKMNLPDEVYMIMKEINEEYDTDWIRFSYQSLVVLLLFYSAHCPEIYTYKSLALIDPKDSLCFQSNHGRA